jgi:4-amino-4-deoxy-L-arabinose transferase-like glycosyltransferase
VTASASIPSPLRDGRPDDRQLLAIALLLVTTRFAFPLVLLNPAWEFHRDEFLYFAMGDHLEWFRMQFPPLIAVVARAGHAIFGDSVWAARVPAAAAGAALLGTMLCLARRLNGGVWSMVSLTLAGISAPIFLRPSVLMHPVIFDQLWATLAFAALVLAAVEDEPRWWILVGVAFGLGALTKFSVGFYVLAASVATLGGSPLRRQLATRWPWLSALLALLLSTPSVAGQVAYGWPFLQQMQALRSAQLEHVAVLDFLIQQPLMLGGAALLLPLGAVAAVRRDVATQVAALVLVAILATMLALHGKGYYAGPGYPVFLVTGVVWFERVMSQRPSATRMRAMRIALPAIVSLVALLLLPLGVPLLDPAAMARYAVATGVSAAVRTNRGDVLPLPQDYADMLGWRTMAQEASRALHALTPEAQRTVLLVGSNYGEAGALAMYRTRFDLPYAVSVAGDFHAWGTYGRSGEVTLLVDRPDALPGLQHLFDQVHEVGRIEEPRAVPEEQDVRIYLARRPRAPVDSIWSTLGPRWN